MTNILLSRYDISKQWCFGEFRNHIKKTDKVAVVALSFRDSDISNAGDWEKLYGEGGLFREAIENSFKPYGIGTDGIEYVNYYLDSPVIAKKKIEEADILYFPDGAADRLMARVIEFDLYSVIEEHRGVVIGFGAGAQVQLANYHITPDDEDYKRFCYCLGFRFVGGIDVEVNYERDERQDYYIKKAVSEKGLPVYAMEDDGALIVDGGSVRAIGNVYCFRRKEPLQ